MGIAEVLAPLSGALVGLILGLIGGGGSILAVPLLVYVVGVTPTHVALGTSALAVGPDRPGQSGAPCPRRPRQMAMRRRVYDLRHGRRLGRLERCQGC